MFVRHTQTRDNYRPASFTSCTCRMLQHVIVTCTADNFRSCASCERPPSTLVTDPSSPPPPPLMPSLPRSVVERKSRMLDRCSSKRVVRVAAWSLTWSSLLSHLETTSCQLRVTQLVHSAGTFTADEEDRSGS